MGKSQTDVRLIDPQTGSHPWLRALQVWFLQRVRGVRAGSRAFKQSGRVQTLPTTVYRVATRYLPSFGLERSNYFVSDISQANGYVFGLEYFKLKPVAI